MCISPCVVGYGIAIHNLKKGTHTAGAQRVKVKRNLKDVAVFNYCIIYEVYLHAVVRRGGHHTITRPTRASIASATRYATIVGNTRNT